MPLLVVAGHPSAGKSTVADRLLAEFQKSEKKVVVIRDENYPLFSRTIYDSSDKEKELRSWVRSEVQQYLTKDTVVICDALNYIKLFLAAKMSMTTYAVVQCSPTEETCRWLNNEKPESSRYRDDVIQQLILRYESPDAKFRWEVPLYDVKIGRRERLAADDENPEDILDDLDHSSPRFADVFAKQIVEWICEGVSLTENRSTRLAPLTTTNYLNALDRATQEVVDHITCSQKTAVRGQKLVIPFAEEGANTITFIRPRTVPELNRLRHQFLKMGKKNEINDKVKIASLFVDFLEKNLR